MSCRKVIELIASHSNVVIAFSSAALGFFGSYCIWLLEWRRRRQIARMQIVINLRHWMQRVLYQISDIQTHDNSGGAGGDIHSRLPNFRFEKSLEVIGLAGYKMATNIFNLIREKDNANAEVEAEIEYADADQALDTFRGRSARVWLTALGLYNRVSDQVRWAQEFSDKDKAMMQGEANDFHKREQKRAGDNTAPFDPL